MGCEGPSCGSQNDGIHGRQLALFGSFDSGQASRAESTMFSGTALTMARFIFPPKLKMASSACKGELSLEPEGWEGDFVPQHLAGQTRMEAPPGKDVRLNNPHFIWEGCLPSQGYALRPRCSLFPITRMKRKIASARGPPHLRNFVCGTH